MTFKFLAYIFGDGFTIMNSIICIESRSEKLARIFFLAETQFVSRIGRERICAIMFGNKQSTSRVETNGLHHQMKIVDNTTGSSHALPSPASHQAARPSQASQGNTAAHGRPLHQKRPKSASKAVSESP